MAVAPPDGRGRRRGLVAMVPLDGRFWVLLVGGCALCVLLFRLWRGRERIVSLDEKLWKADDLSGRPDAVTRRGALHIPHEYKSTDRDEPLEGHVIQTLCYCYLLERAGYRVRYGMLHYGRSRHRVRWSRKNRRQFLALAREARKVLESDVPPCTLDRNSPQCARCSYRPLCHK